MPVLRYFRWNKIVLEGCDVQGPVLDVYTFLKSSWPAKGSLEFVGTRSGIHKIPLGWCEIGR